MDGDEVDGQLHHDDDDDDVIDHDENNDHVEDEDDDRDEFGEDEDDEDENKESLYVAQILSAIEGITKSNKSAGTFVCSGVVPNDLVNLQMSGVCIGGQPLSLPVTAESVLEPLVSKGTIIRAPFGRGQDTLTDLEVRKTWQVRKDAVTFQNDEFLRDVQSLAERAVALMSPSNSDIEIVCHFHKLLIYGPGDFFKPHRDSVHSPLQFATLTIQLPSVYEGGTLKVSQGDQVREVDQSKDFFRAQYTAFYADCVHEVLPITSGMRVCLTFDICYKTLVNSPHAFNPINTNTLSKALEAWYDYHLQNPYLEERKPVRGRQNESWCKCGQPLIEKAPDYDEDGPVEPFSRFDTSETNCIVLVLQHLLPRNELALLLKSKSLEEVLWAFRGTDRLRVQSLLQAMQSLPNKPFDLHFATCNYSSPSDLEVTCDWGENINVCSCMVKSLTSETAREILFNEFDTGNEGADIDFLYEFTALMFFPKFAKRAVFGELLSVKSGSFSILMDSKALSDLDKLDLVEAKTRKNFCLGDKFASDPKILDPVTKWFSVENLCAYPGVQDLLGRDHSLDGECWCSKKPSYNDPPSLRAFRVLRWLFAQEVSRSRTIEEQIRPFVQNAAKAIICEYRKHSDGVAPAAVAAAAFLLVDQPDSPFVRLVTDEDMMSKRTGLFLRRVFEDTHNLDVQVDLARRFIPQFEKWSTSLDKISGVLAKDQFEGPLVAVQIIQRFTTPDHPQFRLGVQCADVLAQAPLAVNHLAIEFWFPPSSKLFASGSVVLRGVVESYCIARLKCLESTYDPFHDRLEIYKSCPRLLEFLMSGASEGEVGEDEAKKHWSLADNMCLSLSHFATKDGKRRTKLKRDVPKYLAKFAASTNVVAEKAYLKRLLSDEILWV